MTVDHAEFTAMRHATSQDYEIILRHAREFDAGLPDRILAGIGALAGSTAGYAVSRLEHSLQSATRAERDGRSDEYVAACLVHDVGDVLAPNNHGALAAAVLRGFVSDELVWIVEHHPVFQLYYYGKHVGADPDSRERYRGHQWFDSTVEFCERYDENCFDPDYQSFPLEHFEPLVRRVFRSTE
jgi:predicted HD phosphohydrolase